MRNLANKKKYCSYWKKYLCWYKIISLVKKQNQVSYLTPSGITNIYAENEWDWYQTLNSRAYDNVEFTL